MIYLKNILLVVMLLFGLRGFIRMIFKDTEETLMWSILLIFIACIICAILVYTPIYIWML